MLILGIDTTTLSCSVALLRDDTVLAELTLNIKKTHSERLMPLLDTMLNEAAVERESVQAIAVAAGPGSFTGLRIGVATARALAQGLKIPAVPVCTLEALADLVPAPGSLICPILDARRSQVYTALYRRALKPPYPLETLLEPAALALEKLTAKLKVYKQPVIFTGEGLHTYADTISADIPDQAVITTAPFRLCRAALVALRGQTLLKTNPKASYEDLLPFYLRQPEAERLAAERQGGSKQ
ncbi:MAG: tRNA (adenosine(37)-N6)-threonylcarbamoyltransferase complex dimerization subunit type 1 TsaB [Bacillota bacterium]|nr:tRNA (adenosine(37)-N6)-threonylcarbamoyltransferase complex dimerization subunit type 1 TsaB [Bacillota bacterium]